MNELALFAGAGGGILGGKLLGWRTVCAVELDSYARSVLLARQRDGILKPFPIWDDVSTFDGKPWRGSIDVISGGFPCTDISTAGGKEGINGAASGLWREMARIIGEVVPENVWVENSSSLLARGMGTVLGDLSDMGYHAAWGCVEPADAGIPQRRPRVWVLASRDVRRCWRERVSWQAGRQTLVGFPRSGNAVPRPADPVSRSGEDTPRILRDRNGVASRVERIRCIGNGQHPETMEAAWNLLANKKRPHRREYNPNKDTHE